MIYIRLFPLKLPLYSRYESTYRKRHIEAHFSSSPRFHPHPRHSGLKEVISPSCWGPTVPASSVAWTSLEDFLATLTVSSASDVLRPLSLESKSKSKSNVFIGYHITFQTGNLTRSDDSSCADRIICIYLLYQKVTKNCQKNSVY